VARLNYIRGGKVTQYKLEKFPGSAGLHLKFMRVYPALISISAKLHCELFA